MDVALLVLSGVNVLAFELTAGRAVHTWDRNAAAPAAGKTVAAVSLAIRIGVVFLGRSVGFTPTSASAPGGTEIDIEALEDFIPK